MSRQQPEHLEPGSPGSQQDSAFPVLTGGPLLGPCDDRVVTLPDYEILTLAGRGAFGSVWVARDRTGVLHALKVIDVARLSDSGDREEEALCLVRQRVPEHPHLIRISHVTRQETRLIYAMELADPAPNSPRADQPGYLPDTLACRITAHGRLSVVEAIQLAFSLLSALEALHAAKLVHRDVKPHNVVFVKGVPKLADIGLTAIARTSLSLAGTPGYLPLDGSTGPDADLYALGKLLYQLVTGQEPADFPAVPAQMLTGPEAKLVRRLNTVLLRACASTKRDRFQDAAELRTALQRVLSPRPVSFKNKVVLFTSALLLLGLGIWALAVRMSSSFPTLSGDVKGTPPDKEEQVTPSKTVEVVLAALSAAPVDDAFIQDVAALSGPDQAQVVAAKMKKLNPDLAGQIKMSLKDGKVVAVTVSAHHVSDLSPLRALPDLKSVECSSEVDHRWGKITELKALQGMKLTHLRFAWNKVADLSPLQGMPLEMLDCSANSITSLEPLRGMGLKTLLCHINQIKELSPVAELPVTCLNCGGNPIEDWSPLARLRLTQFFASYTSFHDFSVLKSARLEVARCENSAVSDLVPLAEMPLVYVDCGGCKVKTLEPLRKAPLRFLGIRGTEVSDLSPLAGMHLEEIGLTGSKVTNLAALKGMPIRVIDLDFDAKRDGPILRTFGPLEFINKRHKTDLLR